MARRPLVRKSNIPVIKFVPLDSTQLFTIEPDDPIWQLDIETHKSDRWKAGCMVRIRPPAFVPIANILQIVLYFRVVVKAKVVKVLPRPTESVVTQNATIHSPTRSPRQVIMSMVQEANTKDRDALQFKMQRVLDQVGL